MIKVPAATLEEQSPPAVFGLEELQLVQNFPTLLKELSHAVTNFELST